MALITGTDCHVLGSFPHAPDRAWVEVLTTDDRATFVRVHRALKDIVTRAAKNYSNLRVSTTLGFHESSGVRSQRPKDLWGALSNEGSDEFVGMPQIFIIASGRGVELGFAASIHRSQFSAAAVKAKLKQVIPTLFDAFPTPDSELVANLSATLDATGGWSYREKTRMMPGRSEYPSFGSLLANIQSPDGQRRGSAAISRYFSKAELDTGSINLRREFEQAVEIFRPLMEHVRLRQIEAATRLPRAGVLETPLRRSARQVLAEFSAEHDAASDITRMARSIIKTVKWTNGQSLAKTLKDKTTSFAAQRDIEEFLALLWERQGGLCALTGAPLESDGTNPWLRVSCDRIDSSKGYEPENMQLTLWAANRFKGANSMQEWESMKAALRVMGLAIHSASLST